MLKIEDGEIRPSREEFLRVTSEGKRAALSLTFEGKGLTAEQLFVPLLGRERPFLLESGSGIEQIGKYSLLGCDPFLRFQCRRGKVEIEREGQRERREGRPLAHLRECLRREYTPPLAGIPSFLGGAVGYFGYDFKNYLEVLPDTAQDDLELPDCVFCFYDAVGILDRFADTVHLVVTVPGQRDASRTYREARDKLLAFLDKLNRSSRERTAEKVVPGRKRPGVRSASRAVDSILFGQIESTHTLQEYEQMAERCLEYIRAGDIYQANLSQRLQGDFRGDPYELYRVLRAVNPSPFASYLDLGDFFLVGCSPERLVRLQGDFIQTRPIAGTRPRGRDKEEDRSLAQELILSPKERAEHIMIVDMARNDIGRVSRYGSVHPDQLMVLEPYSHVIHIVSNIVGRLHSGKDGLDLVAAAFPGASITGVPKIRCMEIVDELEKVRRGPYTGSAGWLSFTGELDLNIIIRTFVLKEGKAYIQVGGGIVADSVPEREYCETLDKAMALIEALERTAAGAGEAGEREETHDTRHR